MSEIELAEKLALKYIKDRRVIKKLKKERADYNAENYCKKTVFRYDDEPETCIDRFRHLELTDDLCTICQVRQDYYIEIRKKTYENGGLLKTIHRLIDKETK